MKQGEIYWVHLPDTEGHEQAGTRPCIIVGDPENFGALPVIFIVPMTSAKGAARFPGVVPLAPSEENGLTKPSFGLVFQWRTSDFLFFGEFIGVLKDKELQAILEKLDELTGRK